MIKCKKCGASTKEYPSGLCSSCYYKRKNKLKQIKGYVIPVILAFIIISLFIRWSNTGTFERFGAKLSEVKEEFKGDMKEARNEVKGKVVSPIKETLSETLEFGCPQINVSMEYDNYKGLNIGGKSHDGWAINGEGTCRKGSKEGENLNMYYCGGYTSFFGLGEVNAYVQKTIISDDGDIGKTYKYVIWNVYDENKNFVETRCVGDPDEFERKQIKAFEREMLKWT